MPNDTSRKPISEASLAELKALVKENAPNAMGKTTEELLAALLPLAPAEISENQKAVEAVHTALRSTASVFK